MPLLFVVFEAKAPILGSLESFVSEDCLILERDGQVSEQRRKGVVEKDLVENSKNAAYDHDYAMRCARVLLILIDHNEEQASQAKLHEVEASKSLVESSGIHHSACVALESNHVHHRITMGEP